MFKKSRAISIIMFTLFITLLVGCNGLSPTEPNDNVGGAAPVYQGMVLSDSVQTLSAFSQGTISNLSLFTNLSTINTENDLKDIIANEMPYENTDEIDHFADLNQEVFITVKLFNPDGQAILRFTLNGVVYQSFQFHAGSDSENLILKVNSGTVSGVKEFTIDEIKYVENGTNEIKDAIFDGDRTIKLGVKYDVLPTVQSNDVIYTATSMSINANIIDSSALIAEAGGTLKAFLITGNEIFDSTDLVLGENTIEFSKLSPNTEYVFVIATIIDVLDGNGKHIYLLLDAQSFTTGTLASIDNVVPTQDSVTFDITVTDTDEVGAITAIELYQGEALIEALTDLTIREFSGLLSNNEYKIKVTYTYDLNDGLGEQELITTETVTTLAKATPEVVVDNVVPTQDTVTFDITVTDADEVGAITAIELYQGETLIEALTDLSLRTFSDLLSNNAYQIKVTYTYDLNDGVGERLIQRLYSFISYAEPLIINSVSKVGTQPITPGDLVQLKIDIINQSNILVTHIKVNDEYLPILFKSGNSLYVEIIVDSEGGDYDLVVSKFKYTSFDLTFDLSVAEMYTYTVNVLGIIEINGIETSNGYDYIDVESIDKLHININNPSGYFIQEIVVNYGSGNHVYNNDQIDYSQPGTLILDWKGSTYWQSHMNYEYVRIVSITYGNEEIGYQTIEIDNIIKELILVKSNIVRQISNPQDLMEIEDGYVYELINDIDLNEISWTPMSFNGVIIGNRYTISNVSIFVQSETQSTVSVGLFATYTGRIYDLNLENVFISVSSRGDVNVGGLVGSSWTGVFSAYRISVSNITIIVRTDLRGYVGGIIGESGGTTISDSYVIDFDIKYIQRDKYTTQLIFDTFIGALAGSIYTGNIVNSFAANGSIYVEKESRVFLGGLAGYAEFATVQSSFVSNTHLELKTESNSAVNGILGYESRTKAEKIYFTNDSSIIHNNLNISEQQTRIINIEELEDILFYVNHLGWNNQFWNFDTLNYINGDFPLLN